MADIWVKPGGRQPAQGGRGRGPWVLTDDAAQLAAWADCLPRCGDPDQLQAHLQVGAVALRATRRFQRGSATDLKLYCWRQAMLAAEAPCR
eukprot:2345116-Prorocentrum_lima.AAC.1